MRTDRGETGWEKTPGILCFSERGEFLAVWPVLERDRMKTLLEPADINAGDEGTGLVLIHTESKERTPVHFHEAISICPATLLELLSAAAGTRIVATNPWAKRRRFLKSPRFVPHLID